MCRIPTEPKIPFMQMGNIFFQFIDKLLKVDEVEYLTYYF